MNYTKPLGILMVALTPGKVLTYAPGLLPAKLIIPGAIGIALEGAALLMLVMIWLFREEDV